VKPGNPLRRSMQGANSGGLLYPQDEGNERSRETPAKGFFLLAANLVLHSMLREERRRGRVDAVDGYSELVVMRSQRLDGFEDGL